MDRFFMQQETSTNSDMIKTQNFWTKEIDREIIQIRPILILFIADWNTELLFKVFESFWILFHGFYFNFVVWSCVL